MKQCLAITGALADENRVRALLALQQGELCVCQIIELLDLAPSTVSKHLSILKAAGLVESRKDGRWINYRPAGADARTTAQQVVVWLVRTLREDPRIKEDRKRLAAILEEDPEQLCRRKTRRSKSCAPAPASRAAATSPKRRGADDQGDATEINRATSRRAARIDGRRVRGSA